MRLFCFSSLLWCFCTARKPSSIQEKCLSKNRSFAVAASWSSMAQAPGQTRSGQPVLLSSYPVIRTRISSQHADKRHKSHPRQPSPALDGGIPLEVQSAGDRLSLCLTDMSSHLSFPICPFRASVADHPFPQKKAVPWGTFPPVLSNLAGNVCSG